MEKKTFSVLITGAARGIGLELVRQYAAAGWQVHACARDLNAAPELLRLAQRQGNVCCYPLDVTSDPQIAGLVSALAGEALDLLIHNAGYYGPSGVALGNIQRQVWRQVLEINTLSPLLLTQALLPNLRAGQLKKIAFLSSKVGSIEDNSGGAGYYYRSSKTALNQVVKSLSIDLAGEGIQVLALHPGWVKTAMGGPNALITPQESVTGLRRMIDALDPQRNGRFYDYAGNEIPW